MEWKVMPRFDPVRFLEEVEPEPAPLAETQAAREAQDAESMLPAGGPRPSKPSSPWA